MTNIQYKIFNPKFKEEIENYLERQHFMKHIGFSLTEIEAGITGGYMDITQTHHQQGGLVHGGLIATIADITAGFAAYSLVPPEHHVVTGEIKLSYFSPGNGPVLYSKGWVIKQGKKINFCEAEVWNISGEDKKLIAKASASMVIIPPN